MSCMQPEEASKKKKKRRSEQDQILKRLTRVADGNVRHWLSRRMKNGLSMHTNSALAPRQEA